MLLNRKSFIQYRNGTLERGTAITLLKYYVTPSRHGRRGGKAPRIFASEPEVGVCGKTVPSIN